MFSVPRNLMRVPSRASAASEPSRSRLTRGRSSHGFSVSWRIAEVGVESLAPTDSELKTLSTASTWALM